MDAFAVPASGGDTVRIVPSSPWVSSLIVLNALVLAAGWTAFLLPGPLSAAEMLSGTLIIVYLVVFSYHSVRHPHDLLEIDTVFLAFFGVYVIVPIVAFLIWQEVGEDTGVLGIVAHFEPAVIVVAAVALFGLVLGYAAPIGAALANAAPRADGPWSRREGSVTASALLISGLALLAILVVQVGPETYTASEYASAYRAEEGLGVLGGGVMLFQLGLIVPNLPFVSFGSPLPNPSQFFWHSPRRCTKFQSKKDFDLDRRLSRRSRS